MNEEYLNSNLLLYRKKLESALETDLTQFFDAVGDKLKVATFASTVESGAAYDGALIEVTLKKITKFAVNINQLLPEDKQVDKKSLVKVCLLQHISKIDFFIKSTEDWKIKKGILYEFAPTTNSLRTGLKSLSICMNFGIQFTPDEMEAMTILDREDEQAKYYCSTLALIVRQANELSNNILRIRK